MPHQARVQQNYQNAEWLMPVTFSTEQEWKKSAIPVRESAWLEKCEQSNTGRKDGKQQKKQKKAFVLKNSQSLSIANWTPTRKRKDKPTEIHFCQQLYCL